jgi:hypothetical protein
MTAKPPATRTVRIVRKSPVAWLNLQLLVDTGILAAVSSFTGSRSPRREVLAALELASPKAQDYFDYSAEPEDEVWIDFIADLGDGFDATHSIAWLVGRDYLGLGPVGVPYEQPNPPDQKTECGPQAFDKAEHVLKAGQITIFGGDLVYPYATQTEYEDRTVGPYLAARPWQLKPGVRPGDAATATGRRLFSIPGNHDWYDGLSAYVQRFCQPGRWMGCWEVQQRRSYFAIKLPHGVWIWGVDLATEDDFDAPQLDYFSTRANDLRPGDEVILCVPKPAWIDRVIEEGTPTGAEKPSRSWESWNKVEKIKKLIYGERESTGARLRAILSGDLHHYSRYETPDPTETKTQLITCGGGGAFLLGTDALPAKVEIGTRLHADFKESFPKKPQSQGMRFGVLMPQTKHWKLFSLLGLAMMSLVWLLEAQGPESFVIGAPMFGAAFFHALFGSLLASPIPLFVTGLVLLGFYSFARSDEDRPKWRAFLAGAIHGLLQLTVAILLVRYVIVPVLILDWSLIPKTLLLLIAGFGVAWTVPGLLFTLYLFVANATLGLHRQEVFSAQAIEDWKGFLRIRVNASGITIFPIGLNKINRIWLRPGSLEVVGSRAQGNSPMERLARAALMHVVTPEDEFEVPLGATHILLPRDKLAPHLIERPIVIARGGPPGDP